MLKDPILMNFMKNIILGYLMTPKNLTDKHDPIFSQNELLTVLMCFFESIAFRLIELIECSLSHSQFTRINEKL